MSRNFSVPVADMLQKSRTVQAIFELDKALFAAINAELDDPFANDWLESIIASESTESAETRQDQQMQETADVLEVMARGRQTYITSKYYIEIAFGNKPNILNKFGLDDYARASDTQKEFGLFLTNLHIQCEAPNQKGDLLAAGMSQAQIDEIISCANDFAKENTQQNVFIEKTTEASEKRDAQYNETYGYFQKANRASKVVFYGNPIKLNQYMMPEGPQPDPDINLKGKVRDAANNAELKDVIVTIADLDLVTKTNFYGNYSFVSVPAGTYTLRFQLAGYTTIEKPVTILATGVVTDNVNLTVV